MKKFKISYLERQLDLSVTECDKWVDLNVIENELIEAETEEEAIAIAMKAIKKDAMQGIYLTVGDSYVLYLFGIHVSIDRSNKVMKIYTDDYGLVGVWCNFSAEEIKQSNAE